MSYHTHTRRSERSTLAPGAHIVTPRRGFLHHGLYVGNGRVIHYAGLGRQFRRGPVEEVSLTTFARGRGFAVQPRTAPRFDPPVAIERARSRLGEDCYRLWSNNCEHFTEWCLNGVSRSLQVEAHRQRWQGALSWLRGLLRLARRGSRPQTLMHG
jgi:hypothetical protein